MDNDYGLIAEQLETAGGESGRWGWGPLKIRTGEERLAFAVLQDAIHCLNFTGKLRDDALRWIWSNDVVWYFSFVNICDYFHIDPGAIRLALFGRKARHIAHDPEGLLVATTDDSFQGSGNTNQIL
jgi:hypothetical protein